MAQPANQSVAATLKQVPRLEQLDSLRGLAALTVMFHHYLLLFPVVWSMADPMGGKPGEVNWLWFFTYTPLHVLWTGHEAVIFFFILSGFVLALPFLKSPTPAYSGYVIKRCFRIYPPYLVAMAIAVAVNLFCYRGGIAGLSDWFNQVGQRPVDGKLIRSHLWFIGFFENCKFNPVIWSLVHEMRISLVFPLLMLGVRRWNWPASLGIAFLLGACNWWMLHLKALRVISYRHDYFETIAYAAFFMVGALLAKHRDVLRRKFAAVPRPIRYGLVVAGILAYTHGWWLTRSGVLPHGRIESILRLDLVADWGVALGIVTFILVALSSSRATGLLTGRFLLFFGKISYSLYLFHGVCLIAFVNLLFGKVSIGLILALAAAASFGLAALSYRWVELPAINAGRWIAGKRS